MNHVGVLEAVEAYERISEQLDLGRFAIAVAVSLAAALATAWIYRAFCESRGTGTQLWRAFPALSIAITSLFLCIQISIPLSLGLLGSLSIIRFRTPVKEPEEVGSVMLVIASSIAAATFHFSFIAVMLAFTAICAFAADRLRGVRAFRRDGLLTISMPDSAAADLDPLRNALHGTLARHSIQSAASHEGRTTLQISFSGLRTDPCALQAAVRSAMPAAEAINVFLDRPGGFR